MSSANDTQIGGDHYRKMKIQHWDFAAANEFDYFQGAITKYVSRWKTKNGLQDLEKALHFLHKYIEVVRAGGFSGGKQQGVSGDLVQVDQELLKELYDTATESARADGRSPRPAGVTNEDLPTYCPVCKVPWTPRQTPRSGDTYLCPDCGNHLVFPQKQEKR